MQARTYGKQRGKRRECRGTEWGGGGEGGGRGGEGGEGGCRGEGKKGKGRRAEAAGGTEELRALNDKSLKKTRSAGARASASITARETPTRTAGTSICPHNRQRSTCKDCGAPACAIITARGAPAKTVGARASASITRGAGARTAGALYLRPPASEEPRGRCKDCKLRKAELAAANARL